MTNMYRTSILALIIIMALAAGATASNDPFSVAEEKYYVGKYKLHQYGWLTPSVDNQKAPLVVILHDYGETHDACEGLIRAIWANVARDTTGQLIVPYTLSIDLRGHGKSLKLNRAFKTYEDMAKPHWLEMPEELAEMTRSIVSDTAYNIDSSRVYLVGSGMGANAAALMTEYMPNAARLAMISPAENYRGLFIPDAVSKYKGSALVMLSSRALVLRKNAVAMVNGNREGSLDFLEYPKRGHGWGLFEENPEAMTDLVKWLMR